MVGNDTAPGISHRISQSSGKSHPNSRSSISSTPYGKSQGSEGRGSVESDTASANSYYGRSLIDNNTTSPGTPSGNHQDEYQPIIDDPTSIERNEPIIQNNYQCSIVQ